MRHLCGMACDDEARFIIRTLDSGRERGTLHRVALDSAGKGDGLLPIGLDALGWMLWLSPSCSALLPTLHGRAIFKVALSKEMN